MSIYVNIFRDFKEYKRFSMDVYSDYLEFYLKQKYKSEIKVSSFIPRMLLSKTMPIMLKMRFARYIEYPFQIRKIRNAYDLNHIIEDGYAHLMNYPLDPKKTIVTVHDIIPLLSWKKLIPQLTYPHDPRLAKYSYKYLKKAAHIIAVSENTKKNLIKFCACKEENISVIYNGCGKSFTMLSEKKRNTLRYNKFKFPRNSFLILITGHQEYKNHFSALKIFEQIKKYKKNVFLVRLGRQSQMWKETKSKFAIKDNLIEINSMNHEDIVELYNSVDCLLFPSWYEGFGFPPLEAMACGIPVISSNAASLPEIVGDAGLMYKPNDLNGMIKGLISIIDNESIRKHMIANGLKQASKFTWEDNLKKTVNVYQSILTEKK